MSQVNLNIQPTIDDGIDLSDKLNAWRDAVHSTHKGTARPSYAQAGMTWIDDTNASEWVWYFYDGANDIEVGTIDPVTHAITLSVAGEYLTQTEGDARYALQSNNLSDLDNVATARDNLGLEIGVDVQAYDADTAKTDLTQSFTKAQRGTVDVLTDGATITPDFAESNNFSVTLGGNRTLANPTNLAAGQSGVITITQDGTGSRTLAYGSYFKFASGTAPTLTTTAGAVDNLLYYVETTSRITAKLIADSK